MKNLLNIPAMLKSVCVGLLVMALLTTSFGLPSKTYYAKLDKYKKVFKTPAFDFSGGKLVVSGIVKGVEVSGGNDGCYTLTVSTYSFAPNGEKILRGSRSKRVCVDITKLPELAVDGLPRGRYIVEVEIDRQREFGEARFEAEINVAHSS